jgi:hypothetical protein
MSPKLRSILLWVFAFILTIVAAVYQRMTGPSYPMRGSGVIGDSLIRYSLIRTWDGSDDAPVTITISDTSVNGELKLKRFKSYDTWSTLPMIREGDRLVGYIPHQPPAGKVIYHVTLTRNGNFWLLNEKPSIIRFKGFVPRNILWTHIILIFLSMFISTRTGLEVIFKGNNTYLYSWITVVCFLIGGMILGPVVQKYSFGAYWTGWPFGHDLTDNKSLVAFIFWLAALGFQIWNRNRRIWALIASVVLLTVYLIPHSVLGSEIDHTKQEQNTESAG